MGIFSKRSEDRLASCHADLQRLFRIVVLYRDCSIICGHRNEESQNIAYAAGKSKLRWPDGKHNSRPSMAVDVVPYFPGRGAVFSSSECRYFAGYVQSWADILRIDIRWGGDWDGDGESGDQTFHDLAHFELVNG